MFLSYLCCYFILFLLSGLKPITISQAYKEQSKFNPNQASKPQPQQAISPNSRPIRWPVSPPTARASTRNPSSQPDSVTDTHPGPRVWLFPHLFLSCTSLSPFSCMHVGLFITQLPYAHASLQVSISAPCPSSQLFSAPTDVTAPALSPCMHVVHPTAGFHFHQLMPSSSSCQGCCPPTRHAGFHPCVPFASLSKPTTRHRYFHATAPEHATSSPIPAATRPFPAMTITLSALSHAKDIPLVLLLNNHTQSSLVWL